MSLEDAINRLCDVLERFTPAAAAEMEKQESAPKAKNTAARVAVTKRSDVNTAIMPKISQSADDPEQTNDYQILWKRFKTAPFTVDQAVRCFKQGSAPEVIKILRRLEEQQLARSMDGAIGWDWMMERLGR